MSATNIEVNEITGEETVIRERQPVVVVDFKIAFWSLVALMVKAAFAAIPAAIIIIVVVMAAISILSGISVRP